MNGRIIPSEMNDGLDLEVPKDYADVLEECLLESDGVNEVINEIICDKTNEEVVGNDEIKEFSLQDCYEGLDNIDKQSDLKSANHEEFTATELELLCLVKNLNQIERFAMKYLERMKTSSLVTERTTTSEETIDQKVFLKRAVTNDKKRKLFTESEEEEEITYSGKDARTKEWVANYGTPMPIWCPPTPPQDDSDIYIDEALSLLYDQHIIPESQLPPVYIKKERKRTKIDGNILESRLVAGNRLASGVRVKDEGIISAPKSLFDRPNPALVKLRQEWRILRSRGIMRPGLASAHAALLKSQTATKPAPEPEHVLDWIIHEDYTLLTAVEQVQEMNLNLVILSPGHTPNWDLIADMVNMSSRTYRSPKQCKNRYESIIIPREEGKLTHESPKKKKNKALYKLSQMKGGRQLTTTQLFQQDKNVSLTQMLNRRFEAIRSVSNHRTPTVKPLLVDPAMKNPKHAEVLAESHIDYEGPLTPVEIAANRADRLAKEKMAHQGRTSGTETVVLRQQPLQTLVKQATATTTSPARQLPSVSVQEIVQEMVGARSGQIVSAVATVGPKQTVAVQPTTVTAATASPTAAGTLAKPATKTISAAQIAFYRQGMLRQQELLRQQQHQIQQQQLKVLRASPGTSAAPTKVFIAVTPPSTAPSPRIQQVKSSVGRPLTESEMVALLKRQQAAKAAQPNASSSGLAPGQILTGIQVKALNSAGKTVSPQQMRHLSLHQQLLATAVAQQRNTKIAQQKVTPIRPPTSQQ